MWLCLGQTLQRPHIGASKDAPSVQTRCFRTSSQTRRPRSRYVPRIELFCHPIECEYAQSRRRLQIIAYLRIVAYPRPRLASHDLRLHARGRCSPSPSKTPPPSAPPSSRVGSLPPRLSCAVASPASPTMRRRGRMHGPLPVGSRSRCRHVRQPGSATRRGISDRWRRRGACGVKRGLALSWRCAQRVAGMNAG
jgi:hypothetical protein